MVDDLDPNFATQDGLAAVARIEETIQWLADLSREFLTDLELPSAEAAIEAIRTMEEVLYAIKDSEVFYWPEGREPLAAGNYPRTYPPFRPRPEDVRSTDRDDEMARFQAGLKAGAPVAPTISNERT